MKIVYLYRLFPNIINISNSLKKFIGGTDLLKNKSSSNYKKKCFLIKIFFTFLYKVTSINENCTFLRVISKY